MLGLGWGELLLIGIVALIVVGPKDLPVLFRQLGQFTGKARGMAREFSRAMEAAADEAGVKDIDRTIRAATDPVRTAGNALRDLTGLKTPVRPAIKPAAAGSATGDLAAKRAGARAETTPAVPAAATADTDPLPLTTPATAPDAVVAAPEESTP